MNTITVTKLLRYAVAYVFIGSGMMKFLSDDLGSYFVSLRLPSPIIIMFIIASVEVICGVFIAFNKNVKLATIPLIIIMIGAFLLTKVPSLHSGFFQFAFNARLDIVLLILLYILFIQHSKK